jgi:hypothetical protein
VHLLVLKFGSTLHWLRVLVGLKSRLDAVMGTGIWDTRESNPGGSSCSQPSNLIFISRKFYVFMFKNLFLFYLFISWLTDGFTFHISRKITLAYLSGAGKAIICPRATYECRHASGDRTPLIINLLKPTGHVMHQQFNVQQLYALPTLYLCVLYLSENKQRLVPLTA